MKRKILTPDAKVYRITEQERHNQLVVQQVAHFLEAVKLWNNSDLFAGDKLPAFSAQQLYLAAANLSFGQYVQFLPDAIDCSYEHVRLKVCGAYSIALPGVNRSSSFNISRGHARVYVHVELDLPPLKPVQRWVPAETLRPKLAWKMLQ